MPETPIEPVGVTTTTAKREDAARRILEAGRRRFPAPDFEVTADEKGTVWIKRTDGQRSVGLQVWQLRGRTAEEALDRVAAKLAVD